MHQREHWSQRFGSLYGSVRYTIDNAFDGSDWGQQFGIWVPQIASISLVIALMLSTVRRLRPGDATYALVYFYIALAPTWLLSGPRYLGAMYALYPMLALITRKRWQHIAITCFLVLGCIFMTYMYAVVGSVL